MACGRGRGLLQGRALLESLLAAAEMLNILLLYGPAIPLLGIYPGEVGRADLHTNDPSRLIIQPPSQRTQTFLRREMEKPTAHLWNGILLRSAKRTDMEHTQER